MTGQFPTMTMSDCDTERVNHLLQLFQETYHHAPSSAMRAPGRINLIGEHIDYSGFGVLPMAIDKDILMIMSFEPSDHFTLVLSNTNPQYKATVLHSLAIDNSTLDWTNYLKAGLRALFDQDLPNGTIHVLVDSNLPSGAGLSSSSAMVICSLLLACKIAQYTDNHFVYPTVDEMVQLAIESETLVGVQSGGMDQAISVYGRDNSACYVEFNPLRITPTQLSFLSDDLCFVVAHSTVTANKHDTAPQNYNKRVVETRVAAHLLGFPSLKAYFDKVQCYKKCLEDIKVFSEQGYTFAQLLALLNMTPGVFKATFHPHFDIQGDMYLIYQRAHHVFSEAHRVQMALECTSPSAFGELMCLSQESARDRFHCSCDQIDQLCAMSNAIGCRLTGAGWGGCTIHLVKRDQLSNFYSSIQPFYKGDMTSYVFETTAGTGACYIALIK